jgi:hypothetical protein
LLSTTVSSLEFYSTEGKKAPKNQKKGNKRNIKGHSLFLRETTTPHFSVQKRSGLGSKRSTKQRQITKKNKRKNKEKKKKKAAKQKKLRVECGRWSTSSTSSRTTTQTVPFFFSRLLSLKSVIFLLQTETSSKEERGVVRRSKAMGSVTSIASSFLFLFSLCFLSSFAQQHLTTLAQGEIVSNLAYVAGSGKTPAEARLLVENELQKMKGVLSKQIKDMMGKRGDMAFQLNLKVKQESLTFLKSLAVDSATRDAVAFTKGADELVFGFRGTSQARDLIPDAQLAVNSKKIERLDEAKEFVEKVLKRHPKILARNMEFMGHSLGKKAINFVVVVVCWGVFLTVLCRWFHCRRRS